MKVPDYLQYTQADVEDMLRRIRKCYEDADDSRGVADLYTHASAFIGTLLMVVEELEDHNADLQMSLDISETRTEAERRKAEDHIEAYRKRTQSLIEAMTRVAQLEQALKAAERRIEEIESRRAA